MYTQIVPYIGMIIGGVTFIVAGKHFRRNGTVLFKTFSRMAGAFFLVAGLLGLMLLPVILWWGFETWLMAGGGLYAAGAIVLAVVLNGLSKA